MADNLQIGKVWRWKLGKRTVVVNVSVGIYLLFGLALVTKQEVFGFFGPFGFSIEVTR